MLCSAMSIKTRNLLRSSQSRAAIMLALLLNKSAVVTINGVRYRITKSAPVDNVS